MTQTIVKIPKKLEQKLRSSARRGAKHLDRTFPNWYKRSYIKLTELELERSDHCILGQIANALAVKDGEDPDTFGYADVVYDDYHLRKPCSERLSDELDSIGVKGAGLPETLGFDLSHEVEVWYDDYQSRTGDYESLYNAWKILDDEWSALIRQRRQAS